MESVVSTTLKTFGLLNVVVGESHLVSLYFHHITEPSRDGKSVMTVMGVGLKRDVFSFVFALSLNSFSYNGLLIFALRPAQDMRDVFLGFVKHVLLVISFSGFNLVVQF